MSCACLRGSGRKRAPFIERTVAGLLEVIEQSATADTLARADGLLQKLDPRVKILGTLLLIVAATASRFLWIVAAIFFIAVALAIFSKVPLRLLASRVWLGVLLFTGVIALPSVVLTPGKTAATLPLVHLAVTQQGLRSAAFLISRAETAATLALLLVLCTPWPHVLRALRVLRVPVVFVTILGMAHRYVFLLLRLAGDLLEARRARDIGPMNGAMRRRVATASAGVLLEKSLALSGDVFSAMQSRGFTGEVFLLDDFSLRAADWWALAAFALIGGSALWMGH